MLADSLLLIDVLRAVLARAGGQRWVVQPDDVWCTVRPPGLQSPKQGWKLHVSATPLSAPLVLARTAEVLVGHGCPFKFATDIVRVSELVGIWYARGSAGKVVTAYPRDDEQFRALAEELHRATAGLAGPRILSDKPLHPGSLVHYRFGAFADQTVFTDDGLFESRLERPDGTLVRDEREAWFAAPAWAPPPFPDGAAPAVAPESPVLHGGRFHVTGVIRHANRGGVYRAIDREKGTAVLLKQARPHVGAMLDGTDVRDRLRDEARMLEVLAPLALFPAKVALFVEQEHLFLAEELIAGPTLDRLPSGRPADWIGRLVAAVRRIHDAGLVVRDLKPTNVIVTPEGSIRLVDAEHVAEVGRPAYPAFTRAFVAPEVNLSGPPAEVSAGARAADCFSLGVTILSALTGLTDLAWVLRAPEYWLPSIVEHGLSELITGLTRADPAARWSLDRAADHLTKPPTATRPACGVGAPRPPADRRPALADGIAHLQQTMTPDRADLWPPDGRSVRADRCNAWLGAAGGLATLTRAYQVLGDESLAASVATAARWIDERLFAVPRILPGLCFGRAGTAWALYDAAVAVGDDRLAGRAIDLAGRLPTAGPIVDVTHGLSGAGLARLYLYHCSGDEHLREQARAVADTVLDAARRDGADWTWPTPAHVDAGIAGTDTFGFAHGIAGVGAFLLAAAQTIGDHRYREAAIGAGDTLVRAVRHHDDRPLWPSTVGTVDYAAPSGHWCNGSTGIGTFLIRLWAASGEQRFADLAVQCGPPRGTWWGSVVGACCGLAGIGQYQMDLSELTGEVRFRAEAKRIADIVAVRWADRGSSYKDGAAGALAFLLRLEHGGPTPWMPDPPWSTTTAADHRQAEKGG